jgi:hypothetical protein
MKIKDLTKELEESSHFKKFKEKNPKAFFTAAFLILDIENRRPLHSATRGLPSGQIQLDYSLPKEQKIAAFAFPWSEPKIHDNIISVQNGKTTPEKIPEMRPQETEIKIDIDDLEETCKKIIKENKSNIKPTKIIAILKDDTWNLTLMDNMLGIIRIKLNAKTSKVEHFNKGGLMEFMGIKKKS